MAPQGFTPQKSIVYNRLLPYSEQIDEEAAKSLSEIKYNLGRAVVFREMSPGILYWGNRLSNYIELYGRHFSKEDHINFIHIFYGLITTPELDSLYVISFGLILEKLLKKRELLSREDLVLDWKPLYKLVEFVHYSKYEDVGLKKDQPKTSDTIKSVVKVARVYFSDEATQEMLDEWRPLLCPFDQNFVKGLFYLTHFLPTTLPPAKYDKGFRLWFDEIMGIWLTTTNLTRWEEDAVNLFSRLAKDNIGYIDWSPYISKIFTRVHKVFSIPVGNCRPVSIPRDCGSLIHSFVVLITCILGSCSAVQEHLEIMFKALESFYHPSNVGRYTGRLQRFLSSLPKDLVKRIHRERVKKKTWETPIPEEAKLTDNDLTKFVECLKPAVMLAIFNKHGSFNAASALQHLALIKPESVLPSLIDKLYVALDTLTEPHQLTATLTCATSVGRSLVRSQGSYTAGRAHVLPLLMSVLPGIDPNDFRKTMATFTFISTMACLVPIVDCSEATGKVEVTEEEKELCIATSQFEDFVLQFIDRCFVMIENSSFEQTSELNSTAVDKRTSQEGMMGMGLATTFHAVLLQCSPKIFESSLQNLFRFCTAKMLETKVAGKMASDMCRAAAKTNSEATLKMFLQHCCSVIEHIVSVEDISKDEEVDDQLLWNLQLVAEMVRCGGKHLLKYREDLMRLAHSTLHLKCKEAADLAAKMLDNILRTLSQVYPLDYRSVFEDFGKPPSEHLFIRDWGKSGDLFNLNVEWHIPSEEEEKFCKELLDTFFQPELKTLEKVIDGSETLPREALEQCLNICHKMLDGATTLLPDWDRPLLENIGHKTMVGRGRPINVTAVNPPMSMGEDNSRANVAELMHKLFEKLMSDHEDDTKALQLIIKIYELLVLHHGAQRSEFDMRLRSFTAVKSAMEDKLGGKKKRVRGLLIERVKLQHEMRILDRVSTQLTTLHKVLMEDLLRLATSHYSQVRIKAQIALSSCIDTFDYLARTLLPSVLDKLKNNPDVSHEEFKGALYLMLNSRRMLFLSSHYWEMAVKVWPALIRADHSEKPSIISLIESLGDKMVKRYDTVAISREMPEHVEKLGEKLLRSSNPSPSASASSSMNCCSSPVFPSDQEIVEANRMRQELHDTNLKNYLELINEMASMMKSENLRWKYMQTCFRLFILLIRYDKAFPSNGIRVCVQYLTHDALAIRKIAIEAVGAILAQQKRPHLKVPVSPYALAKLPEPTSSDIRPGMRPDNSWLQYEARNVPTTSEEWKKHTFVDKAHWGYYTWPKQLLVYAPPDQQPVLGRTREELTEDEQIVYDAFSTEDFVNKLVTFLSLEDCKGKDKFDGHRSTLFKGLFRNFDTCFLELFKPHLERFLTDSQESSQRCALEIIAGLIRGSKHWDFEKSKQLWEFLIPLLRRCVGNVTIETYEDWGKFVATSVAKRDPYRLHPLIQFFLEDPLSSESSSFADASRLYLLQGVLVNQQWRVVEPLHQILVYIEPLLAHSYKNVRDRLGSILCTLLRFDLNLPNSPPTRKEFIQRILPRLSILQDFAEKPEDTLSNTTTNCINEDHSSEDEAKKEAVKLLKTVTRWLIAHGVRTFHSCPEEMFDILPLVISLKYQEEDPDLQHYCQTVTEYLSQMELSTGAVRIALDTMKQLAAYGSWHARKGALSYLQVMVFANLFHIAQNEGYVCGIKELVMNLLADEQLEVREMAAETLSGLVHNGFFTPMEELQIKFSQMATTDISNKKKKKSASEATLLPAGNSDKALIKRHAGVLGLASCVRAYPYDVPQWMPQMLIDLGEHLHDPNPIQSTVKKVLSEFRRTHHDNWYEHKQMFTEDQLLILTDLLVSPCYYA